MKNLPFDITIFFYHQKYFSQKFRVLLAPHVQFSFMYSFLSCIVFFHLLFPLFSLLLLFLLSSFHVIFPAICFLLFSLFLVFPPPPPPVYLPYLLPFNPPPHTSFAFSFFFSFFSRVFIFTSIYNSCEFNFFSFLSLLIPFFNLLFFVLKPYFSTFSF